MSKRTCKNFQLIVDNGSGTFRHQPWVDGSRSKERDRKSELVLRSTYQIFEWDRNNSDRNFLT